MIKAIFLRVKNVWESSNLEVITEQEQVLA